MTEKNNTPELPEDADLGFDRLRASDPASDQSPDSAQLRDLVRDRLAPPVGPRGSVPASRPALRWMKVAAAAAAVLAVGFGGYLVGTNQSGDQNLAATTEVPTSGAPAADAPASGAAAASGSAAEGGAMAVDGNQANQAPNAPLPDSASGAVVREGNAAPAIAFGGAGGADNSASMASGADAAKSSYLAWSRTIFIDGGVTGDVGTAPAWALDPGQVVSAETAARLAAALGIAGDPRQEFGSWVVGPTDGTGPTLSLGGDGAASVNFYDPTVDQYYCPQPVDAQTADAAPAEEPAPTGGVSIDPMPMPTECAQRDVGVAPQGDDAIAKAKEVLALLGLDPAAFNYEAGAADETNPGYGWVSAYSVLNDQRTGVTWQIAFSGPELSSVSGSLAPLVSVGDYPIISAADAIKRLSDPRFGAAGMAYPIDYVWPEGEPYVEPTDVTVPPLPAPGGQIAWPVSEVTITSAQLGVAMQYQSDGSVLLLPTYSLSDASGVSWSVIAVADSALNFAG